MAINPDVPKLLLVIANASEAKKSKHDVIFKAAAEELLGWRLFALDLKKVLLDTQFSREQCAEVIDLALQPYK